MPHIEAENAVGRRHEVRMPTGEYAQLFTSDRLLTVFVRSLSINGAGLFVDEQPKIGSDVVLVWRGRDLAGSVAWARDGTCGIRFVHPLPQDLTGAIAAPTRRHRIARGIKRWVGGRS